MANSTIVYTAARTRFTVPRRAFSTDTINVYYSTNTTSPAPADVLTGAVLVDPGAYTVEGIGARADAFVIDWPAAPTSGTLIVDVESAIGRISNFPDNQLPSGAALNREFDHIITLSGDNATDITALDVRVTTNEGDITALDGRLTTAESDIDALEAWRSGTVDPTLTSHGNRLTAVEGRATALEGRATALEVADVDLQNQINQLVVDAGEIPPVGGGDIAKVLLVTNDGLGTEAYDWQQVDTSGIADDAVTAAKLADDATTDGNRAVTTNHIRDLAVRGGKLAAVASYSDIRAVAGTGVQVGGVAITSGPFLLPAGYYVGARVTSSGMGSPFAVCDHPVGWWAGGSYQPTVVVAQAMTPNNFTFTFYYIPA